MAWTPCDPCKPNAAGRPCKTCPRMTAPPDATSTGKMASIGDSVRLFGKRWYREGCCPSCKQKD